MSLRNDDDHGVGAIDDDILMLIPGTDLWINPSIMHMAPRTPPNPPARKVSGLFEVLNHMVRWGPKLPQNFHDTGLGIRLQQYNKDRALTALVEQRAAVDLMLPLSRRTPGFQILDRKLGGGASSDMETNCTKKRSQSTLYHKKSISGQTKQLRRVMETKGVTRRKSDPIASPTSRLLTLGWPSQDLGLPTPLGGLISITHPPEN